MIDRGSCSPGESRDPPIGLVGEQWFNEYIDERTSVIPLASVGIEISMSDLYEGFEFPDDEEVPPP